MKSVLRFFAGLVTGVAVGVGLLALKRESERTLTWMTRVDPDPCKGFKTEGLQCINTGGITCYLLKGTDGYLLIDTGYARGWDIFTASLDQMDIRLDAIIAVLITHSHPDHLGFAGHVLECSGAQLICHRDALSSLSGSMATTLQVRPLNLSILLKMMFLAPFLLKDHKTIPIHAVNPIVIDSDTSVLRTLGFDANILVSPGHSSDSLTVLTDDGRAMVGDLVMNMPLVKNQHLRPVLLADQTILLSGWRKLLDAGAEVCYPAHGAPVHRDVLEAALEKLTFK